MSLRSICIIVCENARMRNAVVQHCAEYRPTQLTTHSVTELQMKLNSISVQQLVLLFNDFAINPRGPNKSEAIFFYRPLTVCSFSFAFDSPCKHQNSVITGKVKTSVTIDGLVCLTFAVGILLQRKAWSKYLLLTSKGIVLKK